MTLIITAKARQHIVVTADGRCTKTINSCQKKTSDTLQKIFPLSNRGFAIAHHGQNIIEGRKVKDIVEEFFSDSISGVRITTVQQIARLFVASYGEDIRKTLEKIPGNISCGFLFFGFGMAISKSKIYEAYWEGGNPNTVTPKEWHELVLSGDAKKYILKDTDSDREKEFLQKRVVRGKIEDAIEYCDKWYQLAMDRQSKAAEDLFGGHKHQLVITKSGYKWQVPPSPKEWIHE